MSPRHAALAASVIVFATLTAGAASATSAPDLLYERTVMSAVNARCRVFTPDLALALDAARLQARGASLRAGFSDAQVAAVERRARTRVDATPCGGPDVATAASRVRAAFQGWRELTRMDFPGLAQGWAADRGTGREARWRLRQDARTGFDRATLGMGGSEVGEALLAAVDGPVPAGARLIVRHMVWNPVPATTGSLSARAARGSATRVFAAEARSPANASLRPGAGPATVFRFPAAAAQALAGLDARESVAVEFADARGGVRTAYFEVGDFAAGRAFLASGR